MKGSSWVYVIRNGYQLQRKVLLCKTHKYYHSRIHFLNADIMMVMMDVYGIFLVSVESGECIKLGRLTTSNCTQRWSYLRRRNWRILWYIQTPLRNRRLDRRMRPTFSDIWFCYCASLLSSAQIYPWRRARKIHPHSQCIECCCSYNIPLRIYSRMDMCPSYRHGRRQVGQSFSFSEI